MSSDIASGVIYRLREVLAELEQDRKRLDFLQSNAGVLSAVKHYMNVKSESNVRTAIDRVIQIKEDSDRWEAEDYRARMEGMSRG